MQAGWIFRAARLAAICIAALALPSPAFASAFSTNNSDIYNATNESGWAIELVQQADVIFATIYTYDSNMLPIFYTATLFVGGTGAGGNAIWAGDLYVTNGSWFGAPYEASKVTYRRVGAMNYVPQDTAGGAVTFTIDDKGRLSIPTAARDQVARVGGRLVVTYNPYESGCLWLYPETAWEKVRDQVVALPSAKRVHRNLQLKLVGAATVVEPDGNGRILLPQTHRAAAGLEKKAVLLGMGSKFELWSEQAHLAQIRQSISDADLSEDMLDLRL
jgi:MraZ protein